MKRKLCPFMADAIKHYYGEWHSLHSFSCFDLWQWYLQLSCRLIVRENTVRLIYFEMGMLPETQGQNCFNYVSCYITPPILIIWSN